jgi:hypothetical protein
MRNAARPRFSISPDTGRVGGIVRCLLVCGMTETITACGGSVHASGIADASASEGGARIDASVMTDGRGEADEADSEASDAAACVINTSNYDQSCSTASDCVTQVDLNPNKVGDTWNVQSGNYCKPMCICGGGTISKNGVAEYVADVSKTPLGSGEIPFEYCGCPASILACCQQGLCVPCSSTGVGPGEGLPDTGASSGPQDAEPPGSVLCGLNTGPLDSGALAGGPSRWCTPPEMCTPYNGGWACCTAQGAGGIVAVLRRACWRRRIGREGMHGGGRVEGGESRGRPFPRTRRSGALKRAWRHTHADVRAGFHRGLPQSCSMRCAPSTSTQEWNPTRAVDDLPIRRYPTLYA